MQPLRLTVILLVVAASFSTPGSAKDDLKKKQTELDRLRTEIENYEGKIKEKEKKEHSTLELLDTYDRQADLLRRLIRKYRAEEKDLQEEIDDTRSSMGELGGQLSFLKKQYANYVSTIYRYGRTYDLELLLSAKSLNQVLVRSEYLRRFSDQRKRDLDKIGSKKNSVEQQNLLFQRKLVQQRQVIAEKSKEEAKLSSRMKKRKNLLANIRRDKTNYKREIGRKIDAAKDLERMIAKLIEEERVKKEREPSGRTVPPRERMTRGTFESKKGQLRWPVSQGRLLAHFGNQQHPTLRTVTQNPGIDIGVPAGTEVVSVADGEVSAIWWLPSFGNLVILNHTSGFRTVYAHLGEISVTEGEQVKEGERIGTSGESLSGPLLHFEIYKDREKQDPEHWLTPRRLSQR